MFVRILPLFALAITVASAVFAQVPQLPTSAIPGEVLRVSQQIAPRPAIVLQHDWRGWRYLVGKLSLDGVDEQRLRSIYDNPKMPKFTSVYFSVTPKEPPSIYSGFSSPSRIKLAQRCLKSNYQHFAAAERHFKIPKQVIAAVLFVETQCGKITGRSQILTRLSRLASVGDPDNLRKNFDKQRAVDSSVTFEQVLKRAEYLEQTFYPEIAALMKIAEQHRVSVFDIRGSVAGAFGISQFLPSSYLKFGYDGNRDSVISLYSMSDAIWSAANYLSFYGWDSAKSLDENRAVIWNYNRSASYGDAVIKLAQAL